MANKVPSWFKSAIASKFGWLHPLTGEQLISNRKLENTQDVIRPNAGVKSFLDNGSDEVIVNHTINKNTVTCRVLTLKKVKSVAWQIDGEDSPIKSQTIKHTFKWNGARFFKADVTTVDDLGEEEVKTIYVDFDITEGEDIVETIPVIKSLRISKKYASRPIEVGSELTALFSFEQEPVWDTLEVSYVWSIDGEDDVTDEGFFITEDNVGKTLTVTLNATNPLGEDTKTSEPYVITLD